MVQVDSFVKELDATMAKLVEYDKKIEKKLKDYDCGILITMSEIHTIEAIGNHPDANITELAEMRGATKGTLSKTLAKLEKMGLVWRYRLKDNKKDCYFKLTELGEKAYKGHYAMHDSLSSATHKKYKKYSSDEKKLILDFLDIYIEYLGGYL